MAPPTVPTRLINAGERKKKNKPASHGAPHCPYEAYAQRRPANLDHKWDKRPAGHILKIQSPSTENSVP